MQLDSLHSYQQLRATQWCWVHVMHVLTREIQSEGCQTNSSQQKRAISLILFTGCARCVCKAPKPPLRALQHMHLEGVAFHAYPETRVRTCVRALDFGDVEEAS
jgi:hypothetical protein